MVTKFYSSNRRKLSYKCILLSENSETVCFCSTIDLLKWNVKREPKSNSLRRQLLRRIQNSQHNTIYCDRFGCWRYSHFILLNFYHRLCHPGFVHYFWDIRLFNKESNESNNIYLSVFHRSKYFLKSLSKYFAIKCFDIAFR